MKFDRQRLALAARERDLREVHRGGCGDVCVIWLAAAIDTSAFEGQAVLLFSI
jgi:hypothetical protein